jgi:hypothetical protein
MATDSWDLPQVSTTHMARQSSPNKAISISDGRFSWAKPIEVKKDNKPAPKTSGLQKFMEIFSPSKPPHAVVATKHEYNVVLRDMYLEVRTPHHE